MLELGVRRALVRMCMWVAGTPAIRWASDWHGRTNMAWAEELFGLGEPKLIDVLPWRARRISVLDSENSTTQHACCRASPPNLDQPQQSENLEYPLLDPLSECQAKLDAKLSLPKDQLK